MTSTSTTKQAVLAALAPIASEMAEVEKIIAEQMSSSIDRVQQIGLYITGAGGKRMRPALLILMARAMGAQPEQAAYLGAVIEILHTATLMHDDVVDEGEQRRNRDTANKIWGNGQAVLVGDFLYTRSFQMMVRFGNLRVMQALSDAANRLSEGEVLQMAGAHNPDVDEARYFAVIERKTACLFQAAARMAAAIAPATPEMEQACVEYTLHLGNAFQIVDDILDYAGNANDTGKKLGADLREGKVTLPVIYALRHCSAAERELIVQAIREGDGDLASIGRIIQASGALEECRAKALEEAELGKKAIQALPPGQFTESLIKFLLFAVNRDR